ncbi:hypothetical protein Tco_1322697 [Tanacetum coccineum]
MEDGIFFNQSKYIKEMLKKFGLEDSKPMKTPMSSDTKLTKDEERESVDSTKYQGMIGTMHLGLWYPKWICIETVVYADSDHAGDYTALALSTTEAEYVSTEKACQQALWMKQALIDYDVQLDDVPITCDNKGAIDLNKNPVQHSRTKHIKIRHHFLRDNVQKGHISIEKVPSVDNIADNLTKPLKRESFNDHFVTISALTRTEQTQQDTSHEVTVSIEGVEELKRKVKIKGEKKEALLTLRQKLDFLTVAAVPDDKSKPITHAHTRLHK